MKNFFLSVIFTTSLATAVYLMFIGVGCSDSKEVACLNTFHPLVATFVGAVATALWSIILIEI